MFNIINHHMLKLHIFIMPTHHVSIMLKLHMFTNYMFINHMVIMLLNMEKFINVLIVAEMVFSQILL